MYLLCGTKYFIYNIYANNVRGIARLLWLKSNFSHKPVHLKHIKCFWYDLAKYLFDRTNVFSIKMIE